MVIGHFGVGFGAKKFAPKISLGILFIAAQFADLLWPTLLLFNVEHVAIRPDLNKNQPLVFTYYPFTHSLLFAIGWSLCFAIAGWYIYKNFRYAAVLFVCVVSHWILDLIVHFPDLPLYPGNSPKLGFGLWNSMALTACVEGAIFIIGLVFYLQTTVAKNRFGNVGIWILVVLLVLGHIAGLFSPAPASEHAIGWFAQVQWLYVLFAFWVDRNRAIREKPTSALKTA